MRRGRAHSAIGATLISLGLILTAPGSGASQDLVRSGLSADEPLSYHLSALHGNSWLTRHGMWVRHDGMWAFRPTLRFDRLPYFRCQAGYGCGGLGWAPDRFGSWLPFGFGGWDLVPGGWMWFPGQRLAGSRAWDLFWDLWFPSPSHMLGTYGYGPQLRTPFAPFVRDEGRTSTSGDPRPGRGQDEGRTLADGGNRGLTPPLVHPVRVVPVVTAGADKEDSRPSGRDVPPRPSIDRVMPTRPVESLFEPASIQGNRARSLRIPAIDRRAVESTNPGVFRDRVTPGIDRTPSERSNPGAIRPYAGNVRSAQSLSSGQSKPTGKGQATPMQ